ncbi:hypothetical protein [Peribacillus sp. SCS-155]|uniref:hypothetical protein n=1 Tax=Peribacillus sedimenti TaxID=3115297 RepID=UPI00390665A3
MNNELIVTTAEFAEMFGTDKCKEYFAKYKKLGGHKDSTITTAKTKWGVVEDMGRGKGYKLADKLDEEIDRKQFLNYDNCGQGQMIYGYELHNATLKFILDNCKNKMINMSLTRWLIALRLIDSRLGKAGWSEDVRKSHIAQLMKQYNDEKNIVITQSDIEVLEQFTSLELKRLKRNLSSTFEKLAGAGIIIHNKSMFGCPVGEDDKGNELNHRELTDGEIEKVANLKRDLSTKHNVSLDEVGWKTKNKDVIAYKKELDAELEAMGFKYLYETHACVVQASDKQIEKFIDKLNKKGQLQDEHELNEERLIAIIANFKKLFGEKSLELATTRQDNPTGSKHIKQLKAFKEYVPLWEKLLVFYEFSRK